MLMAARNDERYAAEAIESVLSQTYRDLELVIVLDAPQDGTAAIVRSYAGPRVRIIEKLSNEGQVRALNDGLATISTEYVARQDADDVSFPERLGRQVEWLDRHPDVAVLGVQARAIDRNGRRIRRAEWDPRWHRPSGGAGMEWYRMFDTPLIHTGVVFRRRVVEDAGRYDPAFPMNADADLWRRVARHHRLANLDEPLVAFRQHAASMTADPSRPERVNYRDRKVEVIHAQMQDVLRWPEVPRRWGELWAAVNDSKATMPRHEVEELTAAMAQCFEHFCLQYPAAKDDREIARHRASIHARALRKASGASLMASLWRATLRLDRRAALLALPRIAIDLRRRR